MVYTTHIIENFEKEGISNIPMLTIRAQSLSSVATKTNISQNSDLVWKSRVFFQRVLG